MANFVLSVFSDNETWTIYDYITFHLVTNYANLTRLGYKYAAVYVGGR